MRDDNRRDIGKVIMARCAAKHGALANLLAEGATSIVLTSRACVRGSAPECRTLKSSSSRLGVIGGAAHAAGITQLNARLARWERRARHWRLGGRYSPPTDALAKGAACTPRLDEPARSGARAYKRCAACAACRGRDQGAITDAFLLCYHQRGAAARLGLRRTTAWQGWLPPWCWAVSAAWCGGR